MPNEAKNAWKDAHYDVIVFSSEKITDKEKNECTKRFITFVSYIYLEIVRGMKEESLSIPIIFCFYLYETILNV